MGKVGLLRGERCCGENFSIPLPPQCVEGEGRAEGGSKAVHQRYSSHFFPMRINQCPALI